MNDDINSYLVTVPSKTFLSGEYGALLDGPALLINSQPRFQIRFDHFEDKQAFINPIDNEKNPLFAYCAENEEFLFDFDVHFDDPYGGAGGFGASSAQWAALYAFINQFQNPFKSLFDKTQNNYDFLKNLDFSFIESFIKKYRSYTKEKYPPSGYDVISQWIGKIAYIDIKRKILKRMDWPFDDIGFVLAKSPDKVATHEHLKHIGAIPALEIETVVHNIQKSLEEKNSNQFVNWVQKNYELFLKTGFVERQAQSRIEALRKMDGVLAVKGCGALGADVFFMVIDMKKWNEFSSNAKILQLPVVATHRTLSYGFEVHTNFKSAEAQLH